MLAEALLAEALLAKALLAEALLVEALLAEALLAEALLAISNSSIMVLLTKQTRFLCWIWQHFTQFSCGTFEKEIGN